MSGVQELALGAPVTGEASRRGKAILALAAAAMLVAAGLFLPSMDAQASESYKFKGGVSAKKAKDVHHLTLEDASRIKATLKWPRRLARLHLSLRNPSGKVVILKSGKGKPKKLSYQAQQAGDWRLVVRATQRASKYSLDGVVSVSSPAPSPSPSPTPSPSPPPTGSCDGVAVSPAMNVQATIDSHPEGTTFCFASGTYGLEEPIFPKSYDSLIAPSGAVLDGGNDAYGAIHGWGGEAGQKGITVRGFVVQNFASSLTDAAKSAAIRAGWDWTIEKNEVRYNKSEGIRANTGAVVRNNFVHHNGKYGIVGCMADGMLWEGNEISHNNTGNYSFGDAGASKICKSTNVTLRGNYVHHNNGHGLWADTDNVDFLYEGNTVENNVGIGIFHETSYDAVIRNNTVRFNADVAMNKSLGYGSNIQVSVSENVEIYQNTVEADTNGIGIHDIDRGFGAYGEHKVANVSVHHNVVKMKGTAKSGLNGSRPEAFTSQANNRFWKNAYYVTNPSSGSFWVWEVDRDWDEWRDAGQDPDGTVSAWSG
jgi:parallel beta-helix repeat protein